MKKEIVKKKYKKVRILILTIVLILLILFAFKMSWFIFNETNNSEPETTHPTDSTSTTDTITTTETTPTSTTVPKLIPKDTDYVKVIEYIPSIFVELKYATNDNITGHVIYTFKDAYLRYGTVKKLIPVQDQLSKSGYSMKIWDAFRPVDAQYKLWQAKPDARYIANPKSGYTSHSLGNTLDVTLVTTDGAEIDMPTGFDNFTALADRNYSDVTRKQAEHALLLENTMKQNGFKPYSGEWWHFSDTKSYDYLSFNP